MIELDRVLAPVNQLVNQCYEHAFPHLPKFPQFSFTRAMTTLWIHKTYEQLKGGLEGALGELLRMERQEELEMAKQKAKA